jgi:16S rRNA (guanine1207-N2)-methyltransferase
MTQEHYFSAEPRVKSKPAHARLTLTDLTLDLLTDRGVFAHAQVDRGTELLLRTIPPPPATGDLLDLGCGYGPIAITMALRAPAARMWAVDVNHRALELCERNAAAAGAGNLIVAGPDDVPTELSFARIYSNPPVRLGKQQLHTLLDAWLQRLRADGVAELVVLRHLGADSLAAWLDERGFSVERLRSKQGYRILEVRHRPASGHHESP